MALLSWSCVTRTSMRQNPDRSKLAYHAVKPDSLADYIRAVYKLSSKASAQTEQRATLLSQAPELAPLVDRAERDPLDVEARSIVVAEYMSRKLYWGAYDLLTVALVTDDNDRAINLDLAVIWDAWGQYDLALQYGERAISAGAATAQAYETVGRIRLHRNEPDEAIAWYNRSLAETRTATVLVNLGYAQMLKSEWKDAKTALEEAVALDDSSHEAHNNLAIVLSKAGDNTGALAHLMKTGRPAVALNNMGVLYLQEKKVREAQHYFRESLRLEADYEVARRNLDELLQVSTAPPSILYLPALGSPASLETADNPDLALLPGRMKLGESSDTSAMAAPTVPEPAEPQPVIAPSAAANTEARAASASYTGGSVQRVRAVEPQAAVRTFRNLSLGVAGLAGLAFVTGLFALRSRAGGIRSRR